MEKEDFRTVDDKTRSSFRKRAVELHKKGVKKGRANAFNFLHIKMLLTI